MKLATMMLAVALAAVLTSLAPFARADDTPHHFFYNITTDDSWAAGMALTQANVAGLRGHRVTVFLNVRGVHLADGTAVYGSFGVTGKAPRDLLASLIDDGHTVLVCGGCMVAGGVNKDNLIEGATVAGPEQTFGALTSPDTIVMSY